MSSTRHAVMRGPSFTGFGNRPLFTPAHQVDLLTGIGPRGAKMDASRRKPVAERSSNSSSNVSVQLRAEPSYSVLGHRWPNSVTVKPYSALLGLIGFLPRKQIGALL